MMDGNLYKWEGYLSGWSLYYFVLQNGSLCYYKNKAEFENAHPAKDIVNMGLCEINVDRNTTSQFELRIGADSKIWSLKTEKQEDRAIWLRALGSSKACLLSTSALGSCRDEKINENYSETDGKYEEGGYPGELSNESKSFDSAEETKGDRDGVLCEATKSVDEPNNENAPSDLSVDKLPNLNAEFMLKCNAVKENAIKLNASSQKMNELSELDENGSGISNASEGVEHVIRKSDTFFNDRKTKFSDVNEESVNNETECLIPISLLLDACVFYQDFFDRFGGTFLSPIKSDLVSNIAKIRKVIGNAPKKMIYLQDLIQYELDLQQNTGPDTGTQALLWMNRGLRVVGHFIYDLLTEGSATFKVTSTSFVACYSKYLAKHHNWVVQRLFKVGMKMLPTYDDFVECMTEKGDWDRLQSERDALYEQIHIDGLLFANNLIILSDNICKLYGPLNMEV